ncbi:MAG: hypothetical protein M3O36_10645 [Myxococcota bacterium]|nr:hypothetical protein [Myxococcota bacterium]
MNLTTLLFALVASLGALMHPNDVSGGGPSGAPQSTAAVSPGPVRSVGVDDVSGGGPSNSPHSTAAVIPGPVRSVGVDDVLGGGPVTAPHP